MGSGMPKVIDYYAVLAVPPDADLVGIENAYARISSELVRQMEVDETAAEAMERVNEAYAVLSNPVARRAYDQVLFAEEFAELKRRMEREQRRERFVRMATTSVLLAIIAAQSVALAYLNWEAVSKVAATVFGPLLPDIAV